MLLSELKKSLTETENVNFIMPDGTPVPQHFHVTEVGLISKHFMDCGGKTRKETRVSLQLWHDTDLEHRLAPEKLLRIIGHSEKTLGIADHEIVVEYQQNTIGTFGILFNGNAFLLTNTQTACLAMDKCGIPEVKDHISLSTLGNSGSCCKPGSDCC